MHKTTYDRRLTGVYWPIHTSRRSGARVGKSTRTGDAPRGAGRGLGLFLLYSPQFSGEYIMHLFQLRFSTPQLYNKVKIENGAKGSLQSVLLNPKIIHIEPRQTVESYNSRDLKQIRTQIAYYVILKSINRLLTNL